MWGEMYEISALATAVERAGGDLCLLVGAIAVAGEVDYRSRAADVLRARLAALQTDATVVGRAVDDAADALHEHAAAVAARAVAS